jgi:hypothetical protein
MLLLFFLITVQWLPALSWFERGSADNGTNPFRA